MWHLTFDLVDEKGNKTGAKEVDVDVVIQGMGGLSRWDWPNIPGLQDFQVRACRLSFKGYGVPDCCLATGYQVSLGGVSGRSRSRGRQARCCHRIRTFWAWRPHRNRYLTFYALRRARQRSRSFRLLRNTRNSSTITCADPLGSQRLSPRRSSSSGSRTQATSLSPRKRRTGGQLMPKSTWPSERIWSAK